MQIVFLKPGKRLCSLESLTSVEEIVGREQLIKKPLCCQRWNPQTRFEYIQTPHSAVNESNE